MKKRNRTERALARAQRLLARAESLCREVAEVLCTPAVRRAERKVQRAGDLVEQAIRIAAAPALARLGFRGRAWLPYTVVFVDEASRRAIERIRHGLVVARPNAADLFIPDRRSLYSDLVEEPRETWAELARVARLEPDSPDFRNLQASLRAPAHAKRGRSRAAGR